MCGNFDMVTVNDMTTAGHMEVSNAQAFGNSWALGQVCECNQPCYMLIRYKPERPGLLWWGERVIYRLKVDK